MTRVSCDNKQLKNYERGKDEHSGKTIVARTLGSIREQAEAVDVSAEASTLVMASIASSHKCLDTLKMIVEPRKYDGVEEAGCRGAVCFRTLFSCCMCCHSEGQEATVKPSHLPRELMRILKWFTNLYPEDKARLLAMTPREVHSWLATEAPE